MLHSYFVEVIERPDSRRTIAARLLSSCAAPWIRDGFVLTGQAQADKTAFHQKN
jgi:hypothetical protein